MSFLETYPDPHLAQQLTYTELEQFLKAHHYTHPQRLDRLYQHLGKTALEARVWQGLSIHAQALVPILRLLNQQITQIKREIREVFDGHPEASWWQSLPGAGDLTAPRLLASVGDNRAVFPTAAVLQARAGTVPVTRRSGKSNAVRFRQACDKALRKAFVDFARNSISQSGWARSYYFDHLDRGHDKNRAIRGLANRWAGIIWTIWMRRDTYKEALHVATAQEREGLWPVDG